MVHGMCVIIGDIELQDMSPDAARSSYHSLTDNGGNGGKPSCAFDNSESPSETNIDREHGPRATPDPSSTAIGASMETSSSTDGQNPALMTGLASRTRETLSPVAHNNEAFLGQGDLSEHLKANTVVQGGSVEANAAPLSAEKDWPLTSQSEQEAETEEVGLMPVMIVGAALMSVGVGAVIITGGAAAPAAAALVAI